MICDSHVHMGYYRRAGYDGLYYYSPRKVAGVMRRIGVDHFIVSSTTAQFDASYSDLLREAEEMKRIAGEHAHVFFWMTEPLLKCNPNLEFLETGLFDGVKFHELVTPWFSKLRNCFNSILEELEKKAIPVQIHTGNTKGCRESELEVLADRFPALKMDFAHFFPASEMIGIMNRHCNVFTDVAMYIPELYSLIPSEIGNDTNVMFGSDFPAYHESEREGMSISYRRKLAEFLLRFQEGRSEDAFERFLRR